MILQYNWPTVRLLASPPIRLVVKINLLPRIIRLIQIKHIYYVIEVGILLRYTWNTMSDLIISYEKS
jgi:hypothetical protein